MDLELFDNELKNLNMSEKWYQNREVKLVRTFRVIIAIGIERFFKHENYTLTNKVYGTLIYLERYIQSYTR